MGGRQVCLGEFDEFVFVLPADGFTTGAVDMCLHLAAAFIFFLYSRT